MTLEEAKIAHVQAALELTGGKVAQAAKLLDVDRRTLYRMIKRYGLKPSAEERTGQLFSGEGG